MVDLLAEEGEARQEVLTAEEQELLVGCQPITDELARTAKFLIGAILKNETRESSDDPKSLGNSMTWASDGAWSNVVELTYEVADSINPAATRLKGWPRVKDKLALIGCGLLVVVLMFVAVGIMAAVFRWK